MKIKADKEGQQVISQLVDLALKYGGIQALPLVNAVQKNFELIKNDTVAKNENTGLEI